MKPINRRDKINQKMLLELDRQAKERILELHLREALDRPRHPMVRPVAQPQDYLSAG